MSVRSELTSYRLARGGLAVLSAALLAIVALSASGDLEVLRAAPETPAPFAARWAGKVVASAQALAVRRRGGPPVLGAGEAVQFGDRLTTGEDAPALIDLGDGSLQLVLEPATRIEILPGAAGREEGGRIVLLSGRLRVDVLGSRDYELTSAHRTHIDLGIPRRAEWFARARPAGGGDQGAERRAQAERLWAYLTADDQPYVIQAWDLIDRPQADWAALEQAWSICQGVLLTRETTHRRVDLECGPEGDRVRILSGRVQLGAPGQRVELEAGSGLAREAAAPPRPPRPLLSAPLWLWPRETKERLAGMFKAAWTAVPGAVAYRLTVARLGPSAEVVEQRRFITPRATHHFDVPGSGHYRLIVEALEDPTQGELPGLESEAREVMIDKLDLPGGRAGGQAGWGR